MIYEDLIMSETTESLSLLAMIEYDFQPFEFERFREDVGYCTKDFVANIATLLMDMDNVYFLRISN